MRWRQGRRSSNVDDRRRAVRRGAAGGGIGLIVLFVLALFLGVDPTALLQNVNINSVPQRAPQISAADDELAEFVSVVLADTEDTWNELFRRGGQRYEEPVLVMFSGSVRSACGTASSAMGPFYCPADKKVYIDLGFYRELRDRLGAPGDFAQAYVIAHEVGHHIQNLLGIAGQVHSARQRASRAEGNALQVRMELQADCLAGVWANQADRARRILERGDVEEALNAASAIGDDTLQKQSTGRVVPDSFTHGTSAQRVRWFRRGLETGDMSSCDTFEASRL